MAKPNCCMNCRHVFGALFFVALAIVAGVLGYIYYFGDTKDVPEIQKFRDVDPFANMDPRYAAKWPTNGTGGLTITLLNALESKWYPYFKQAVYDWDHGTPDALTLSTQQVSVDSTCTPIDGVLKVCNGNYGNTGWRGLTTVALSNNIITSSISRMNEYYFQTSSDDQYMQFTMCHEIGHGFGLNHTDENFNNLNLGNCMDYTDRPKSNEHPDVTNYDVLAKLYGLVGGGSYEGSAAGASTTSSPNSSNNGTSTGLNNGRRSTRLEESHPFEETPWDTILTLESFLFNDRGMQPPPGLRRHVASRSVETLEYDLGDGFSVQFHLLR